MPIKYGSTTTINSDGSVTTVSEEVFSHYKTVKKVTMVREVIHVEDDRDILTHFLKLLDDQKAGSIDQIGVQCLRNPNSGALRIEKTWTIAKE